MQEQEQEQEKEMEEETMEVEQAATAKLAFSTKRQSHSPWPLAALGQGLKGIAMQKFIEAAMRRGREFTSGSTADMILETAATNCLSRAVYLWRSEGRRHEALGKVEEFLSRVSRKQLKC